MNGAQELQQLQEAGFSPEEQNSWAIDRRKELSDAGFAEHEVNTYFGIKEFDPAPVHAHVNDALKEYSKPATEGGEPKPVTGIMDALKAGFGESSLALLMGKPTTTVAPDASRVERIASSVGTLAGDVPAMVAGYIAGGANPVTGTAGAFALPAGIRKIMMDKYEKGESSNFSDFWDRFSGAFIESAKGYITGAATGAVGKAIGLAPIVSPTAKAAATVTGEIATMVMVGNTLQGQVPEPNDFIDTALTLGFIKGSARIAGKLRNIYAETGVKPDEVAQDIQKDPTILHELASEDVGIPRVYSGFHGSPNPIAGELKPSKDGSLGAGIYFAKDKSLAEDFSKGKGLTGALRPGFTAESTTGEIIEADVTLRNPASATDINKVEKLAGKALTGQALQDALRKAGFDGIETEDEIVAFSPSQVKTKNTSSYSSGLDLQKLGRNIQEWEPDMAMGGGAPGRAARALPAPATNIPIGDAQKAVLDRLVLKDPETEKMTLSDIYTSVVDNLNPILKVMNEGGKADLETGSNAYELERLTRGIAGKATEFLNHGAFDFDTYKTTTPGYFKILEPVKKDLDGFRAYMVAKRTIEKEGQGIKTGVPLQEAETVVREGAKKYEKIHRERIAYREALLDTLHKSGILSAKAVEAMQEANKEYVPFYRFFEDDHGRPISSSSKTGNPIKRMKGGEQQIIDPIISDIKDTFLFLSLAEKNAARKEFVKLGTDFAEKQKSPLQATHLTEPEIRKMFDEFLSYRKEVTNSTTQSTTTTGGSQQAAPSKQSKIVVERVREALLARGFQPGEADQMMKRVGEVEAGKVGATIENITKEIEATTYIPELDIRLPNEVATVFRSIQKPLAADEIAVFENGKRNVYQVDPKVAEAFNGVDFKVTGLLAKIAYAPASLLRAGVTITPDFIARNMMRDAVSSFIYAGSNPIKTMMGLKSIVTKDTAFQNWQKGGGANATLVAIDRDYLATHLGELDAQTGLMRRAWNVAKIPLDILRATSELIENSTRIGAVRSGLMQAKTKAQIQALSLIAREATVDFSRHGKDTQAMSRATAFFNPAIQGIDRFAREAMTNPLGMTAKAVASVTLPSMLLWYANKDDKEIQDLPRWQKDLFWVTRVPLPSGGSFILRVPKPQEFGILFGTVPERLLDAFVAEHPDAMRDLDKSILGAFTPSLIPTAAVPIISQFANRDTFRGHPLIPAEAEKLLPEYQYTGYTTELAKAMGQIIGAFPGMESAAVNRDDPFVGGIARALTSPILIENYVRSWTGGMGMYLFDIADKALRESGGLPDPVKPASTLADVPVVRAFVVRYPSATAQSIQDFYSDYDKSKTYFDTIQSLAKQGDERALSLIDQHTEDLVQLSGIRQTLIEQSQIIRMIDKNQDIAPDEKRQLIDTLYFFMIEVSRGGNEALRELKTSTTVP